MADKKESALGAVTDFAQARVLDASGASKNIDKATMASVLAGQIGHGGNLSKSADEILHTSFYAVTENAHGCPSGYGILLTFELRGWYDVIQIYFGYSSKIASYRIHQTGWSQWINLN